MKDETLLPTLIWQNNAHTHPHPDKKHQNPRKSVWRYSNHTRRFFIFKGRLSSLVSASSTRPLFFLGEACWEELLPKYIHTKYFFLFTAKSSLFLSEVGAHGQWRLVFCSAGLCYTSLLLLAVAPGLFFFNVHEACPKHAQRSFI